MARDSESYSRILQVQQACDIVDIVSEHVRLDRKGREFIGICPFHDDHRPSMYVSPEKQIFKCFACGAGGDVFKFVQLRENLNFGQALERLAQRAGIELKTDQTRYAKKDPSEIEPGRAAKVNAWAMKVWQDNLAGDAGAAVRQYISGRGISDESVKTWSLGYALADSDGLMKQARARKVPDKLVLGAGLAVQWEMGRLADKFRNRLMFPIVDVTGRVIGFGGRTMGDDPAKYMNSPATVLFDKSNCVYGLYQARHAIVSTGRVVVVEGYTDVIMCHQYGVNNVVATLGTSFTSGHAKLLRRYARQIVLVFDSDVAGMEAANRAMEVCLSEGIDIRVAFVSSGKDPCEFLPEAGREAFESVIDQARDVMEYKWQRLMDGMQNSETLMDKRAVTEEFLQSAALSIRSGRLDTLGQGLMVNRLSEIVGLGPDDVKKQLGRYIGRMNRTTPGTGQTQHPPEEGVNGGMYGRACREILEVLLSEPDLYTEYRDRIEEIRFDIPIYAQIAAPLLAYLSEGPRFSLSELLARIESTEASGLCVEMAHTGEQKANYAQRLADAIRVVDVLNEDREKERVKQQTQDGDQRLRQIQDILRKRNERIKTMRRGNTVF